MHKNFLETKLSSVCVVCPAHTTPLCHSLSPLRRKTFPTLFAILAEFVSARSRRKSLEKRKSSGKIIKKKMKKIYKPFCILFRFRLDPDLDTVPDPSRQKHQLATPLDDHSPLPSSLCLLLSCVFILPLPEAFMGKFPLS